MKNKESDIAIVGLGAVFPGARNPFEFWGDILAGANRITEIPDSHWNSESYFDKNPKAKDKTYCKQGGFIPKVSFDPLSYGLPPSSITATDSGQIVGLIVAKQVIDNYLRGREFDLNREKVSVILGTTGATELIMDLSSRLESPKIEAALKSENFDDIQIERVIHKFKASYPEWQESSFPGLLNNVVSGRIAHRLNLKGTNYVTDAACASSLAAVKLAIDELLLKRSDMVVTGGVDTLNTILMYMCFSKTPALSPSQKCCPFDSASDGTIVGEGVGMLALKRLEDALTNKDRVYAVIKGVGSSSDGLGKSIYAPKPEGQARAIKSSYDMAGFSPNTLGLIEAHGTGTRAGDECELEGLNLTLKSYKASNSDIAIGSVKSQIGHTKAAAGAAGMVKASLALYHKVLPPSINVSSPNQKLKKHELLYINTHKKPWIKSHIHPRRAGVSSFGFGGTNFHIALEEHYQINQKYRVFPTELYLACGNSEVDLTNSLTKMANDIKEGRLKQLAENSQRDFDYKKSYRIAIVSKPEILLDKIENIISAINNNSLHEIKTNGIFYSKTKNDLGKIAFLFPGQASQYLEMGSDLSCYFETARNIWDQASSFEIFNKTSKLHEIVYPRSSFTPSERKQKEITLRQTNWAQPAISITSASYLKFLHSLNIKADYHAGHSLGELSALWASGVYTLEDLATITRVRGNLMSHSSLEDSGMIAVNLTEQECQSFLNKHRFSWVIANINGPQQTVISGSLKNIHNIKDKLLISNIKYKELPVSAGFHSPIMDSLKTPFYDSIHHLNFKIPTTPVISGSDASFFPNHPNNIKAKITNNISLPVRFIDTVKTLYNKGVRTFIELGPNNILSQLTKNILKDKNVKIIYLDKAGKDSLQSIWDLVAQLSAAGFPVDFRPLKDEFVSEPRIRHPKHAIEINGANIKKHELEQGSYVLAKTTKVNSRDICGTSFKQSPIKKTEEAASMNRESEDQAHIAWLKTATEAHEGLLKVHENFQKQMAQVHLSYLQMKEKTPLNQEEIIEHKPKELTQQIIPSHIDTKTQNNTDILVSKETPYIAEEVTEVNESIYEDQTFESNLDDNKSDENQNIHKPEKDNDDPDTLSEIISCVANKTGYPADMLNKDQSLEEDLGVDSIKRVEIFSSLSEKFIKLQDTDAADLNEIQTISDIFTFIKKDDSYPVKKKTLHNTKQAMTSLQ